MSSFIPPGAIGGRLVAFGDSANLDAFSRLRVSNPVSLFDTAQINDTYDYLFFTNTLGAGGTVVYSQDRASRTLNVFAGGDSVVRQSKQRFPYQPGKSLLVDQTFRMVAGQQAGVTKRIGMFDTDNGIFLESNGTNLRFVIRSFVSGAPVDTAIDQSNWNLDPLDGSGASRITLDITKVQILIFDFQWLGSGRVRIGFDIDGLVYYAHEFFHANVDESVYLSNPNLPLQWSISSSGGIGSLEAICGSVSSEGGYSPIGLSTAVDRGIVPLTVGANSTAELMAIQLLPARRRGTVFEPLNVSILSTSNTYFRWLLNLNPTNLTPGAWVAVATGSALQRNTTRGNVPTPGYPIASGYGPGNVEVASTVSTRLKMASDDVLSLIISNLTAGGDDFYCSVNCREEF